MNSIAFDVENEKHFSSKIQKFFRRYQVSSILKKCNAYKEQGFSVVTLMQYLFCLVFRNRSMFLDMQSRKAPEFGKDTVYRLKNSTHIDWKRFTTLLSARIITDTIEPLTSESRRNAFIVDDSLFERQGSKKVKLLAKVFDHASHRYTRGFRMLTLGWSDGVTFLPVNCCLLSSENESSRINHAQTVDSNSNGAKARKLAAKKATEVIPELISDAMEAGIPANSVATVSSSGLVTALRSGTTVITATARRKNEQSIVILWTRRSQCDILSSENDRINWLFCLLQHRDSTLMPPVGMEIKGTGGAENH